MRGAARRNLAGGPSAHRKVGQHRLDAVDAGNLLNPPTEHPLVRYVPRVLAEWIQRAGNEPWQSVDATLAFFDISGFTTLTERLTLRGKIGAEELTDVLNLVFGSMMDAGYARGGSLLKFGGDALLMFFEGDDHVLQACNAAVEMRTALRSHSPVVTAAGKTNLRVSIGVHTGALDLFRVGTAHRELIVAGPVATRVAEVEASAEPGEIVVSEEVMRALPAGATRERDGTGATLRWRVSHHDSAGFVFRDPSPPDLESNVPVGLREHLADGIPEPAHHLATVAFVMWSGVDALLHIEGPGTAAAELHSLMSGIQEAAGAEEIVVLSTDIVEDGGKLILTAGVPRILPDDEGRMLRTTRAIVDLPTRLAVHIGVNHGHVFAGDIGTARRGSYTIMDDSVNVAARSMGKARPGRVLSDPETLQRSSTRFSVEGPFELSLKGRVEPALAYDVGGVLGQRTRAVGEFPFVGRQAEVQILRTAIVSTGCVVVTGDRGIGKTRLVTEALSDASRPVLEVGGEPHLASSPYAAFAEPLRQAFGIADRPDVASLIGAVRAATPADIELVPLVAEALQIPMDQTPESRAIEARFRMARTADVLISALEGLVSRPLVVWLDDLHWMDASSLDLSLRLAANEPQWLAILAFRTEFDVITPADAAVLRLTPIDEDLVRELIDDVTEQSPLRPDVVGQIMQRADGNPFFLDEMVRLAHSGADLDAIPESLDATVGAQIDRLAPRARQLTRFASVLGKSFDVRSLVSVLDRVGMDVEPDELTGGSLRGIFEPAGAHRVGFRHAVVQKVAYEALSYGRRSQLHREAASVLTERASVPDAIAAELAVHHLEAGQFERAYRYSLVAAEAARARFANAEAARFFSLALGAASSIDSMSSLDLYEAWVALGDVREQSGQFAESRQAYQQAERLDVPSARKAHALYRRALAEMRDGRYTSGLRSTTRGLAEIEGDESKPARLERAQLSSTRASIRMAQWQPKVAQREARKSIPHATAVGDLASEARARLVLHWASIFLNTPGGHDHGVEALRLSEELGDLDFVGNAANSLGGEAYFEGDWDGAVAWYRRAEETFARAGNDVGAAYTQGNIGEVLVNQRRFTEANAMLRGAVRVLAASTEANDTMFVEVQLARSMVGEATEEAVEILTRVLATATETKQSFGAMEAATHLALTLALTGRGREALDVLDRYEADGGEPLPEWTTARVTAHARSQSGDVNGAARAIDDGIAAARTDGSDYEEALLMELSVEVGRSVSADEKRKVAGLFSRLGVLRSV